MIKLDCRFFFKISWIFITSVLLAACSQNVPNTDATAIADAYLRTQAAASVRLTLTAAVSIPDQSPTSTEVNAPPTRTPTLLPTEVQTPTLPAATETPVPTATQTPEVQVNCTNRASFVKETIEDNSLFQPGQVFTKTWTLQNTGTCTWTTAYSFSLFEGEQMGGPQSTLLPNAVPPQSEITISLQLTAPDQPGSYKGDYILKNATGESFGVGRNANLTVWVLIKVVETEASLNLGTPTWFDNFELQSGLWPLFQDDQTNYEIKNGALVVSALQQSGDLWRVASYPSVSDQYIQAVFKTSESCTGKNSYGFAIRSYAQNDSIYDNGYFAAFACNGSYRIYSLVDGTFTSIQEWTIDENLRQGAEQTNRIGVLANGNELAIYINGAKIATFTDSSHTQGQFGILIRAEESAPFVVSVEEFSYWEIK
jgi:hypothetical protein